MTGKQRYNLIYTILVVLLSIAVLLQFYDMLNSWTGGTERGQRAEDPVYDDARLLQPLQIAVSSGRQEGRSALLTEQNLAYYETYRASWDFLQEILEAQPQAEAVSYEELNTNRPVCRYLYASSRSGEMLLQAFPENRIISGESVIKEMEHYSSIWIVPAENVREESCVYLVGGTDSVIRLSAQVSRGHTETFLDGMRSVCDRIGERYFDCAVFYPEAFAEHILLRDQTDPEVYTPWRIRSNSGMTQDTVFRYIRNLFSYPEVVRAQQTDEETWIFTDDRVSVRAERSGMISYIHTPTAVQTGTVERLPIADAYDIAYSFVSADIAGDGQPVSLYLDSWETTETGYIFRWNYQKDGRTVIPEKSLMQSTGMQSGLQLEIRGEEVYRYQCWKIRLESAPYRTQILTESAFSIIGAMERADWESIRLVYRIEDGTALPYWELLQGDEKSYIKGR